MMTDAEIRKLLGVRAAEPTVLSLYLGVPRDPPALRVLPARADELLARAGRDGSDNPDVAQAQDESRRIARRMLDVHARDWLGRTIAVFACAEPRLAETVVLPGTLADRAVFATRPHVRPLLAAGQRRPAAGQRERRPAGPVPPEPGARTVTGLRPCLTAVNQRAVGLLLVPDSGMIPGFVCQRCGQLSITGTDCMDWGAASLAVPDLIEEMAVTALEDGAQVETIPDPPGGIAARLRFSLVAAGEPPLPRLSVLPAPVAAAAGTALVHEAGGG